METLRKIDDVIAKIEAIFLSTSIITMTVLLVGNVVARKVFNSSWTFAEEVGQLLVVVCTFMGLGYAVRTGEHVNMTAVTDNVPKRIKKMLVIFISALSMITMFYFAYLGFKYANIVFQSGRVTPALEFPRYIVTLFMPIGFFSGGIRYLINLIINFNHKDEVYTGNLAPDTELSDDTIGY